jgi:hypothetical protein
LKNNSKKPEHFSSFFVMSDRTKLHIMSSKISLNQQLDAFSKKGIIVSPDGNINEEGYWNFHQWLCDNTALESKARELMKLARQFTDIHPELNLDRHYVSFNNKITKDQTYVDEIEISDDRKKVYKLKIETTGIKGLV